MRLRIAIKKDKVLEAYRDSIEHSVDYTTKGAPSDFHQFMMDFLEFQAKLMIKRIEHVMQNQLYHWHPLSESWKQFKRLHGLSPKIWLASGQVRENIHYWYNYMSGDYFCGVHPTKRHKGYGKTHKNNARIADIVRWMECGTPRMPARPLFGKVMDEFATEKRQTELYKDFIRQKKGF